MKTEFLHKRNKSLKILLTCLAICDFLIFAAEIWASVAILLMAFVLVAALVCYTLACEQYLQAKGQQNASDIAATVMIISLVFSLAVTIWAMLYIRCPLAIYFGVPLVFFLVALPLKKIPDRA